MLPKPCGTLWPWAHSRAFIPTDTQLALRDTWSRSPPMKFLLTLASLHAALGRLLDPLRSLFLLATRLYVGWQFWKSGWLKLSSWSSTLDLFRTEYHVPLLPPEIAAVTGAFGEVFFPALLFLGLF